METRELHENWKMRCTEASDWQEAVVPGTVYTDLLRNGNMENPYWKDNEDSICALMEKDYEYECTLKEEILKVFPALFFNLKDWIRLLMCT